MVAAQPGLACGERDEPRGARWAGHSCKARPPPTGSERPWAESSLSLAAFLPEPRVEGGGGWRERGHLRKPPEAVLGLGKTSAAWPRGRPQAVRAFALPVHWDPLLLPRHLRPGPGVRGTSRLGADSWSEPPGPVSHVHPDASLGSGQRPVWEAGSSPSGSAPLSPRSPSSSSEPPGRAQWGPARF